MLNFAFIVVIPGCTFLRRFIDLTKGIVKPHNYMNLIKELYKSRLSSLVIIHTNGRSILFKHTQLHLYTNAVVSLGFETVFGRK